MHYDDEDHDPYAPRIGPAAMPSPRSKFAPYFSGCTDTLEDFLEEFEGLAYDCELTDPQRVDVIIRYVDPSLREFWRSLNGYHSRDWPLFKQSLINIYGNTTPRHQVLRQKLRSLVQDSSRRRMDYEDDVLQYYRQFLCFSAPLVHLGHLTEEDRDAAFWYGFHPDDRQVLWPRLLGKNPFQPSDVPFHFEVIFVCARGAFAYGNPFPPWLHEQHFQPSSVRCERPVAKHGSRDTYGLREMSRAVTSNAETTGNLEELPSPPQSMPQPQSPSSSPSASEPQQMQAPSVTLDQPEPAHTFSSTLLPSTSPPSHVYLASDSDPIPASMPPSFSLKPSAFPTPTHIDSLARSDAEISSILPLSSIMPTSTMPSVSSGFQCLPSATEHQSEPEPAPTLFASVPTLPFAPSHVHSTADNDSIFASTPPSSSPTSSTFLPSPTQSVIVDHLVPELVSASSTPPSSLLFSIPPPMSHAHLPAPSAIDDDFELTFTPPAPSVSSIDVECLHSPATSATDCQSEPASTSESSVSKFGVSPSAQLLPPDCLLVPPISSSALSSLPLPEISTLNSTLAAPPPNQSSSSPRSLSQLSRPRELESSTSISAADVVTLSHPELSESSQDEFIPFLPASLEPPPIAPVSPHSTPPRLPGLETVSSDSFPFEIAPPIASSVARRGCQEPHEVQSIKPPALAPRPSLFHSSPSLRLFGTSARFGFTLALVTAAVLASILNISATVSTVAHKYSSKQGDIGNNQIGTLNTSNRNIFAQQPRFGQHTPRDPRLVFDPGGQSSSSCFQPSARKDIRQRKTMTRIGFITTRSATLLAPILANNLIVFDPGGVGFVLESAHEDSAMFDEDAR